MNKEEIINKVAERYGKMWDIKPHVLAGKLWWKDAIEDALDLKDEEIKEAVNDFETGKITLDEMIKRLKEKEK